MVAVVPEPDEDEEDDYCPDSAHRVAIDSVAHSSTIPELDDEELPEPMRVWTRTSSSSRRWTSVHTR